LPIECQAKWIDSVDGLAEVVAAIRATDRIAIDTEFHGERSYLPHLMLVQIATHDAIFLVDPLGGLDIGVLFAAIAAHDALVIGHALQNDLEIVALGHNIVFDRLFDTQIAASFLGAGLQIGLSNLLRSEFDLRMPKGAQMADWSRRPLPERQLSYAADDVRYLLRLHTLFDGRLNELGRRAWVDEECAPLRRRDRYGRDPMACWQRVTGARKLKSKEAGVLVELAAERERIAAEVNQVPHFLLSDEALLDMARHMPRKTEDLDGNRRTTQRNVQRYADRWLAAVERGVDQPFHVEPGRPPALPGIEAVANLIMLLVAEISAREGIAAQLMLRRRQVLEALQVGCPTHDALCEALGLFGWRAELLEQPIWLLLDGQTQARVRCGDGDTLGVDFV
jgi:ribonuclease D